MVVLLHRITYFDVITLVSHVTLLMVVVVQNSKQSSIQYVASSFRPINNHTSIHYQFYYSKMLVLKSHSHFQDVAKIKKAGKN